MTIAIRSSTPRADMSREKASELGNMWGSWVEWSESSSMSKKIAPVICLAKYRERVSTGGVTPTGGSVASRITVPGSPRRSASQEGVVKGFMDQAYLFANIRTIVF